MNDATTLSEEQMESIDQWPSAGWHDAFSRQATAGTWQAAKRCAEFELSRLERLGVIVAWEAEDVAQEVMTATAAGTLAWLPGTVSLRAHLKDKIRQLARRARRRYWATELGSETVEIPLDDLTDKDPIWSEVVPTAFDAADQTIMRDLVRRTEANLWLLAAKDTVARRVLKAVTDGETTTTDIAAVTGLPAIAVQNARRRLRALADRLPADLREGAGLALPLDDDADDGAAQPGHELEAMREDTPERVPDMRCSVVHGGRSGHGRTAAHRSGDAGARSLHVPARPRLDPRTAHGRDPGRPHRSCERAPSVARRVRHGSQDGSRG
ncbi:MAG TPA: hypothetical protein VHE35_07445 [Kofleriaceae bacterium]|nr:hypothetical protein [Kofleriaceae bacterium]